MQKLSSSTVYQLSLEDLKEALTLYMALTHEVSVDIHSLNEVMKTEDNGMSYDCITYLDGIKIYSNI